MRKPLQCKSWWKPLWYNCYNLGNEIKSTFSPLIWSSSISFPDSTCCKIASGGYDCCPLSDAVCCPSGLYCCPSGSSCNEKDGSCTMDFPQTLNLRPTFMMSSNNKNRTPSFPDQFESKQENLGTEANNKCPDKEQECGDKETCCKLQSGGFGCCPYPGEFLSSSSINLRYYSFRNLDFCILTWLELVVNVSSFTLLENLFQNVKVFIFHFLVRPFPLASHHFIFHHSSLHLSSLC